MVPPSSITIATKGECLTSGGISLGETVHLGNFEFIADYFGSLSISQWKGDQRATFMGSTHTGASSKQRAMIENSTE
jgi:hypothetical protein